MAISNQLSASLKIATEAWIFLEINKTASIRKGIDDSLTVPVDFTRVDILCGY